MAYFSTFAEVQFFLGHSVYRPESKWWIR